MDFDRAYADYVDDEGVREIQAMEKETGTLLLAYYTPPIAANVSVEHLKKIQDLEKKLCVRLVAYERPH